VFAAYFLPVAYMLYSSTVKIGAVCSSETSVDFCQTAWRHFLEGGILKVTAMRNSKKHISKIYLLKDIDHTLGSEESSFLCNISDLYLERP
jgi:hypothetical protein